MVFQTGSLLVEFFSIGFLSFQSDFLRWVDQSINDGFADYQVFEQFEPTLRLDLGSDDGPGVVVALFEDVHPGSGLLMGVASQPQVIKDQNLDLDKVSHTVEIMADGLDGLDFLEQKVNR
jgi:hypothetical protein